ncbi:MAG: hypothetical protein LQ350_005070 [Teloschistes chrysophthalmus]|nr:MAG: hypothetical protein LQ350_005070 [Niorma chrysophthalma]
MHHARDNNHVRTAFTPTQDPDPAPAPFFNSYTTHLIILSSLNVAFLVLNTIDTGMGLWIFGHGNNGTAHWEGDSTDARGTWSILSTCIITLTLCVYTSLHLNIPAHKSTTWTTIGMKAKYVVFGLLAPELIVFNAWRQRTVAASLVARLRKERGGKQDPPFLQRLANRFKTLPHKACQGSKRCFAWITRKQQPKHKHENGLPFAVDKDPWSELTLVHGFYIVMGGFTFDESKDPKPRIWPRGTDRLTPNVMTVLACLTSHEKALRDVLPWLSEEEIWDKSKANGLAKTIVCIQAAWFCTQCIARLGQGMPISLLELNTFAHAVCALLVYILWWNKPLDVHEPTVVDVGQSDTIRYLCALAWSGPQSPVPHLQRVKLSKDTLKDKIRHEIALILQGSMTSNLGDGPLTHPRSGQRSTTKRRLCAQITGLRRPPALEERPKAFHGLDPEAIKSCTWACSNPPVFVLEGAEVIPSTSMHISTEWTSVDVDEVLLERLKVVETLRSLPNYPAYEKAFSRILEATDPDLRMLKPRELNFTDSLMRQSTDVNPVGRNLTGATGIVISGVLYGGLHTIAWGSNAFTSPIEDLAWKISCFIVAGGGLLAFAGIFGLDIATKRIQANRPIGFMKGLLYAVAPIYMSFTLLYLVCRVYLVFEVFRNLGYLDPAVYKTPESKETSIGSQPLRS